MQIWNLFACKSKLSLPFGKHMFQNSMTWLSVAIGLTFGLTVVYLPLCNAMFLTSRRLNPVFLLIPFAFGAFLFLYASIRRYVILRCKCPFDVSNKRHAHYFDESKSGLYCTGLGRTSDASDRMGEYFHHVSLTIETQSM